MGEIQINFWQGRDAHYIFLRTFFREKNVSERTSHKRNVVCETLETWITVFRESENLEALILRLAEYWEQQHCGPTFSSLYRSPRKTFAP